MWKWAQVVVLAGALLGFQAVCDKAGALVQVKEALERAKQKKRESASVIKSDAPDGAWLEWKSLTMPVYCSALSIMDTASPFAVIPVAALEGPDAHEDAAADEEVIPKSAVRLQDDPGAESRRGITMWS